MIRPSSAIEKWWFQVREILDLGFSRTCSCYSKNFITGTGTKNRDREEKKREEEKEGGRKREGE